MEVVLSVIVVPYNCRDYLEHCLRSLDAERPMFLKVIVVDNNSSDGTADMVESSFPWAQVVRLPENLGFSRRITSG